MPAAAAAVAAAGQVDRAMAQPADILLVDDDPDLLKLISLRLTSAGYRVRTADSGETALAALAIARPATVITDMRRSTVSLRGGRASAPRRAPDRRDR